MWLPTPVYDEKGTNRRIQGRWRDRRGVAGLGKAIPDSKGHIRARVARRGHCRLRDRLEGVHTGPLQTPTWHHSVASNKPIEVPACQVVQVEGGKVKSVSHYFDMLTLLTQIGATTRAAA